jgi:hypothetical protein
MIILAVECLPFNRVDTCPVFITVHVVGVTTGIVVLIVWKYINITQKEAGVKFNTK